MNLKKNSFQRAGLILMTVLISLGGLTSCFNDDDDKEKYKSWRESNEKYLSEKEASGEYERVSPVWAPGLFILMKYHTRPLNYGSLVRPLSTSTVDIKYRGMLMDSTVFDSSYNRVTYGDSIYRCQPCKMIAGFSTALTEMVPGDSVTVIIPARAGYGQEGTKGVKPYSTLIFDIKMRSIYRFDSNS